MTNLTAMSSIGREMARQLNGEEIGTAEKLAEIGAEEAFSRLKTACPQVCLAHLYALEGAARNMAFNSLSQETKADLQAFSDNLKQVHEKTAHSSS